MDTTATIQPFRLDPAHPNFIRWQRAIDHAILRGELVCSIISDEFESQHPSTPPSPLRRRGGDEVGAPSPLKRGIGGEVAQQPGGEVAQPRSETLRGKHILDIGCGVGGTSITLHRHGARITALDSNPQRLAALRERLPGIATRLADASNLPFEDAVFDAVVLQDVLEHVEDPVSVVREVARVLSASGILYLSTPSRIAPMNILADPHWGLPFASLMSRNILRRYLQFLRPDDAARSDLARLLTFMTLTKLLEHHGFKCRLKQRSVMEALLREPRTVVWSDGHLRILRWIDRLNIAGLVQRFVNDEPGIFNRFLAPSWHMICRKVST